MPRCYSQQWEGKAALWVFTEFKHCCSRSQFNIDEVAEGLPHMARK